MLSCSDYDYIEIVCMFRYPIKVITLAGKVISGIAMDTARNSEKAECLKIYVSQPDTVSMLLPLMNIATLSICVDNPHFDSVSFS